MKTLKVICTSVVLALALSVPAYAGEVSTPGVTSTESTNVEPGDIETPGIRSTSSSELDSADLFEFLLTLVF